MENFTSKTLGELLSSSNEAIRRNAMGILKQLQKEEGKPNEIIELCPACMRKSLSYKIKMKLVKIPNYPDRWVCPACNYEKLA